MTDLVLSQSNLQIFLINNKILIEKLYNGINKEYILNTESIVKTEIILSNIKIPSDIITEHSEDYSEIQIYDIQNLYTFLLEMYDRESLYQHTRQYSTYPRGSLIDELNNALRGIEQILHRINTKTDLIIYKFSRVLLFRSGKIVRGQSEDEIYKKYFKNILK
jgi:hypothetical protein